MSALVTRRRALLGSAAAAIGLSVPAIAAPSPAGTVPMRADAKALQEELCRLSSAYRRACREADEASGRVDYPDPPEALYARPGDGRLFARHPEPSWSDKAEGRDWWAGHETVEQLRTSTFGYLDGHACPVACARRDEIVGAFDAWQAADQQAEDVAGYTAAQDRYDAAHADYVAFRARLVEMRTGDPDVLTVKALAIADLIRDKSRGLGGDIERAIERDGGPWEGALALSLARDFLGLMGPGVAT